MRKVLGLLVAVIAVVVLGCGDDDGDDDGDGSSCCAPIPVPVVTSFSLEETCPLGFSGADLLAEFDGPRNAMLTWSRGGETGVTIDLVYDGGEINYHDYDEQDCIELGYGADSDECDDYLRTEFGLKLRTDDGRFDETWKVAINASKRVLSGDDMRHAGPSTFPDSLLDLHEISGSYPVEEFVRDLEGDDVDVEDCIEVSVGVHMDFNEQEIHGSISGLVTIMVDEINGIASSGGGNIATW